MADSCKCHELPRPKTKTRRAVAGAPRSSRGLVPAYSIAIAVWLKPPST
jgi:hypothetical protein